VTRPDSDHRTPVPILTKPRRQSRGHSLAHQQGRKKGKGQDEEEGECKPRPASKKKDHFQEKEKGQDVISARHQSQTPEEDDLTYLMDGERAQDPNRRCGRMHRNRHPNHPRRSHSRLRRNYLWLKRNRFILRRCGDSWGRAGCVTTPDRPERHSTRSDIVVSSLEAEVA
jgi:hypothetical protein